MLRHSNLHKISFVTDTQFLLRTKIGILFHHDGSIKQPRRFSSQTALRAPLARCTAFSLMPGSRASSAAALSFTTNSQQAFQADHGHGIRDATVFRAWAWLHAALRKDTPPKKNAPHLTFLETKLPQLSH
jgi:hypothetical protein